MAAVNYLCRREFSLLLSLLCVGCGGRGSPLLSVESQQIDFGVLSPNGGELRIPLTNTGNGPLDVRQISTTCACTVAEVPERIHPGETRALVIRTPKGGTGPMVSKLIIHSNDSNGPHELFLSWFRESPPKLDPPQIVVQGAQPGETVKRSILATYAGGDPAYPLEIEEIETSDHRFELTATVANIAAKVSDRAASNLRPVVGETSLEFRCRVPEHPTVLRGVCLIHAAQAGRQHTLTLPVEIHVAGILSTQGLFFFSSRAPERLVGQKRTVIISVSQPGNKPLVTNHPGGTRHSLRKIGNGDVADRYELELELTEQPGPAGLSDNVVVQLAGEPASSISIPVSVMIASQQ